MVSVMRYASEEIVSFSSYLESQVNVSKMAMSDRRDARFDCFIHAQTDEPCMDAPPLGSVAVADGASFGKGFFVSLFRFCLILIFRFGGCSRASPHKSVLLLKTSFRAAHGLIQQLRPKLSSAYPATCTSTMS